jgi:hypothetical protein
LIFTKNTQLDQIVVALSRNHPNLVSIDSQNQFAVQERTQSTLSRRERGEDGDRAGVTAAQESTGNT